MPANIFLRPYPNLDADRRQLSVAGGYDPRWARSGRELFFLASDNKLMGVTIEPGPVIGRATQILDNRPYVPFPNSGADYDVAPDGRFLMIKLGAANAEPSAPISMTIVAHWVDELKARVK